MIEVDFGVLMVLALQITINLCMEEHSFRVTFKSQKFKANLNYIYTGQCHETISIFVLHIFELNIRKDRWKQDHCCLYIPGKNMCG